MYKLLSFAYIFLLSTATLLAQSPTAPANRAVQKSAPKLEYGKIKGQIIDEATKSAVPFATIALTDKALDQIVGGTVADADGSFVVNSLKPGKYLMTVSFIGYSDLVIDEIEISEIKWTTNVGDLLLKESTTQLDEIVIKGEKDLIEEKVDRIVYNAERDVTTMGGDATDVLRRVPLLAVDLDGNVSLRGSQNIKVLINNRPSTITAGSISDALKQIPADQIKSVEVITSPSARYDAEGTGGIINIITKKNDFEGSTLSVNTGVGLRASNLGVNGSVRKGRHSLNLGGYGRYGYNTSGDYLNHQTIIDPTTGVETTTVQEASNDTDLQFSRYNLGWDYEFNKYNWLSASVSYGTFKIDGAMNNLLTKTYQEGELINDNLQDINFVNHSTTVDYGLNYIRTFETKGKELSILLHHSQNERNNDFENINLETASEGVIDRVKNENLSNNDETTVQLDYTSPMGDNKIIEIGGKHISRKVTSDYSYFASDGPDQPYIPVEDDNLTNVFDYSQQVSAAYLSYTQNYDKNYSLKAGARYEYTDISASFVTDEIDDIPSYGVLVPSINISKRLKSGNTIKVAYNRRIQRPSLQFLNPNIQATNPKDITQGNPNLDPEYTNNYEISYGTFKKGRSINISAFARNTNGSIQPVREIRANGVIYTGYENIGEEDAYGVSIFGSLTKDKKFMVSASVDTYYAILENNLSDPLEYAENSGMVVNGRIFGSYSLSEKWSLQGFGFASGRQIQLQGHKSGFYMYSLSLNRKFKDDRGSIGFGAENFFTKQMDMITEVSSPLLSQSTTYGMRNMNFKVNLSYRFGKMDFKPRKKRKSLDNGDLKKDNGYNQQMMQ